MLNKLAYIAYGVSFASFIFFFLQGNSKLHLFYKPRTLLWFGVVFLVIAIVLNFSFADYIRGFRDGVNSASPRP